MKGLFCCFPGEFAYPFSVSGIKDQQLFASPQKQSAFSQFRSFSNSSQPTEQQIFSSYWLFANSNPLLPLPEELLAIQKRASQYAKKLATINSSSAKPIYRFSKYSMISTLNSYSAEQLENGVMLALCRVLIIKLKTVSAMITDEDIEDALAHGCDAIFSNFK
jgi:hypothetical protein